MDRITALEHLAQSNSRTIQAILDAMAETADERRELREATLRRKELTEGITASLDDDRPTILGRLNRIENKVDRLLKREQTEGGDRE